MLGRSHGATRMPKPDTPSGQRKSEFLGLHDPYATTVQDGPGLPRVSAPLFTREKLGEFLRAGATLLVILLVMAIAVAVLS